jgi:hypothetical protein
MSSILRILVLAFALVFSSSLIAQAKEGKEADSETKINKKDLPAAVLHAFQREYPLAKITGAAREIEADVEYYEIESKEHGTKRDMLYRADGGLVSVEEVIRPHYLPAFVREAVMQQYPKGKIKSAEKITRAGLSSFEVVVRDGNRYYEVALTAYGRITETEEKTGKD